jgi:hypothetical protein
MGEGGFSKRLNPTAWVRALRCNTVYITRYRSMRVPVSIRTSYFMADKKALVDSGATDNFMHPAFAKRMGLGLQELPTCYGRLAVVSDVDDGGFALNVDKELRGSAVLYRSKYNGAMLGSRWT